MPVLLLARGDKEGKDLLRRALEARYGLGAPVIDTLRIEFKGRKRAKIGPVMARMPIDGTVAYHAPLCARLDFTARPVGLPLVVQSDAFDGTVYRKRRGREALEVVTNANQTHSLQQRLWAGAAMLLTPLVEPFVELRGIDERSFSATNTDTDDTVEVHLNPDFTLASVTTTCYNVNDDEIQPFSLRLSDGQARLNDLMLPRKIAACWSNVPEIEIAPASLEINPHIDPNLFRLEA